MDLAWDGSDISSLIGRSVHIETDPGTGRKILTSNGAGVIPTADTMAASAIFVLVKKRPNALPCVIDELKRLFCLQKIGSHYYRKGLSIYVITRFVETSSFTDANLKDPVLVERIKKVFAYRDLTGCLPTTNKSIIGMRTTDGTIVPVTLDDNPKESKGRTVISPMIRRKWFVNEEDREGDMRATFAILILVKGETELSLKRYRDELTTIIKRVDPDCIWYLSQFMERLVARFT